MADDIIKGLRSGPEGLGWSCDFASESDVINQAADLIEAQQAEIERLRTEVDLKAYRIDGLLDEIKRLRAKVARKHDYGRRMHALAEERLIDRDAERALADQLAEALRAVAHDHPSAHTDDVWTEVVTAFAAYEEARRG